VQSLSLGGEVAEEFRVKEVHPFLEETASRIANAACFLLIGVVEQGLLPAVGGYVADGVDAMKQGIPVYRRRIDAAGESAADTNDCQRLARGLIRATRGVHQCLPADLVAVNV